ncbi:MAG: response regulator transcription factor [Spirochaetes bacterium]|nr:response regulator transcription factor [Spirochaetota bacterium]
MINLIIVEDNEFITERVQRMIGEVSDMQIVGAYNCLRCALAQIISEKINLIVLDLKLPDVKGTAAIESLSKKYPKSPIVVYSICENELEIIECIAAGVAGYVTKDTPLSRLVEEFRVVAAGGTTFTPKVIEKLLRKFSEENIDIGGLSPREAEILDYMALGMKYDDIAEELELSVHTVRRHIERVFVKLNVHNRTQAVARAVSRRIIRID